MCWRLPCWVYLTIRAACKRVAHAWRGCFGLAGFALGLGRGAGAEFALYPYVYLLAQEGFAHLGVRVQEVGQSLGLSPWRSFWRVVLPSTRPWWMGGRSGFDGDAGGFGTVCLPWVLIRLPRRFIRRGLRCFRFRARAAVGLVDDLAGVCFAVVGGARSHRRYQALGTNAPIVRQKLSFGASGCEGVWFWGILSLACFVPVAQLVWVGAQTQLLGAGWLTSLLLGVWRRWWWCCWHPCWRMRGVMRICAGSRFWCKSRPWVIRFPARF